MTNPTELTITKTARACRVVCQPMRDCNTWVSLKHTPAAITDAAVILRKNQTMSADSGFFVRRFSRPKSSSVYAMIPAELARANPRC